MQEERRSKRLTQANLKTIQKIAAWGNARAGRRKRAVFLLVAAILWFYLLAALRRLGAKYRRQCIVGTAALTAVLLAWGLYTGIKNRTGNEMLGKGNVRGTAQAFSKRDLADGMQDTDTEDGAKAGEGSLGPESEAFILEDFLEQTEEIPDISMLSGLNPDCVGWLYIAGTTLSYPVMQHEEDEDYYLDKDFFEQYDKNGCLILDNDSSLEEKGSNLIIHGHNTADGSMFGSLKNYRKKSYGMQHGLIQLKTEEETRTYQLMAVFRSQVYYADEEVFKYYTYFGGTAEEFQSFYENIKSMSLYDTGVEAVYGDEFLTLSTCAYHVENGRLVVVAKRIY